VPPRHFGELCSEADAVVLARVLASRAEARGNLVFTQSDFVVLRSLSGPLRAASTVTVEAPGGSDGERAWLVPGSPSFETGASYLLALRRKNAKVWLPATLAYGVLKEQSGRDGSMVLAPIDDFAAHEAMPRPDGAAVEPIGCYRRDALLDHLQKVLRGSTAWSAEALRAEPLEVAPEGDGGGAGIPAGCAFFSSDGRNFRWRAFDTGSDATISASEGGDLSFADGGLRLVQEAMDLWMGISGTSFNLVFGGEAAVSPNCTSGQDAEPDFILFNDPCSDIAALDGCGGVLAYGGPNVSGTHTFDGATWWTITGWIVVVNDGSACIGEDNYRVMLAHELGHGLGYAHVQDSGALMFANCCNAINNTDRTCARYSYPAVNAANLRPVVNAGGDRSVALAGNTLRLRGTATDDGLPAPAALTTTWRQLAGPGTVVFADPSSLETLATFSRSGAYLLGLEAHDGQLLRVSLAEVNTSVFIGSVVQASFQQGAAGYRGTVDTFLEENAPSALRAASTSLNVDLDDPSGTGLETQALLRFEDVFGAGAGQVPPGAPITAAWLDLTTTNSGAGAAIHRMSADWDDGASWASFGGDGLQAGTEAEAAPDATVPGSGTPLRADVTASLAAWSQDPCESRGWAFLSLGTDGWDFDSAEGTVPPRLTVEYQGVVEDTLIAVGDNWRYFKGVTAPPAQWNQPGFVPGAGWLTGRTGIGYADGDDATVLTDMRGTYITVYCRREFDVARPSAIGRLILAIDYDDGFSAYLNGVEVARSASLGLVGSPLTRNTLAASREAGTVEEYFLDAALLVESTNVLAVEVHNADVDSSDLSFIPELSAQQLLVPDGAEWRFLRGSSPVPADWADPDFDDSAWELGPTGIGYADGDDLTELTDMQGNYLSVFCRREFTVADPAEIEGLRLTVIHDDGVVVYLNGTEAGRANMPAGPVTAQTAASTGVESAVTNFNLPPALLRPGRNVLAASVHNQSLANSDLSFMPVLVPLFSAPGGVSCGVPLFRRGDALADGVIDISDPVRILFFLFAGTATIDCLDAADFDDSGSLGISDAVGLLNFLFRGSAAPPAPGTECGPDPSADGLGDCATAGCAN
jgi:hypothetical protein